MAIHGGGWKSRPPARKTRRRGPSRRRSPVSIDHLSMEGEFLDGDGPEMVVNPEEMTLATIRRVANEHKSLRIDYTSSNGAETTDRVVHPYELRWESQIFWLYAFDPEKAAMRRFKVHKISRCLEGPPFDPKYPIKIEPPDEEEEPNRVD